MFGKLNSQMNSFSKQINFHQNKFVDSQHSNLSKNQTLSKSKSQPLKHQQSSEPDKKQNINQDMSQQKPNQLIQKQLMKIKKNKMIKKQRKDKKIEVVPFKTKEQDLQGAKFRILNEILYTSTSKQALEYFKSNSGDYNVYHEGYRHQAEKWNIKPVDHLIKYLISHRKYYLNKLIADLGCGQGFIYEALLQNGYQSNHILSYDLVSTKDFIIAADIANLPVPADTLDLCIFCLSLMGTNYLEFIREAHRKLKAGGEILIAEVESRSKNWKKFIEMIQMIGFKIINNGEDLNKRSNLEEPKEPQPKKNNYFRIMHFRKVTNQKNKEKINFNGEYLKLADFSKLILESCSYKKR